MAAAVPAEAAGPAEALATGDDDAHPVSSRATATAAADRAFHSASRFTSTRRRAMTVSQVTPNWRVVTCRHESVMAGR